MSLRALEFLIPGDLQAGTGGYVYDRRLIEGLRALGWKVAVHALDASFPEPTAAALDQANHVLARLADQALVLIDGLALSAMPAVAHAHAARLALVGLMHRPLGSEAERQALRSARHIVVTGRASQATLCASGVIAERISLVEPGTDPAPLARPGSSEQMRLLCVATVTPDKGHELLIEALAPLAPLRWHLTCVGSLTRGPAAVQRLHACLQRTGLTGRVTLVGEVPAAEVSRFYQDADLFVLATRAESYGMAVAEAVAHGLPVISTRTGAIPEVVGHAGRLVMPGDGKALQQALALAIGDPRQRAAWARGALSARARLSDWPGACGRMARVLEAVAPD